MEISIEERRAIAEALRLGHLYGYGNMIHHLKQAWSDYLVAQYGMSREQADYSAGFVCPTCKSDCRG